MIQHRGLWGLWVLAKVRFDSRILNKRGLAVTLSNFLGILSTGIARPNRAGDPTPDFSCLWHRQRACRTVCPAGLTEEPVAMGEVRGHHLADVLHFFTGALHTLGHTDSEGRVL